MPTVIHLIRQAVAPVGALVRARGRRCALPVPSIAMDGFINGSWAMSATAMSHTVPHGGRTAL